MGWLGTLLVLYGTCLIGEKRSGGFLVAIVGEVFWMLRGLQLGSMDIIFVSIAFAVIYYRNWRKWNAE